MSRMTPLVREFLRDGRVPDCPVIDMHTHPDRFQQHLLSSPRAGGHHSQHGSLRGAPHRHRPACCALRSTLWQSAHGENAAGVSGALPRLLVLQPELSGTARGGESPRAGYPGRDRLQAASLLRTTIRSAAITTNPCSPGRIRTVSSYSRIPGKMASATPPPAAGWPNAIRT